MLLMLISTFLLIVNNKQ